MPTVTMIVLNATTGAVLVGARGTDSEWRFISEARKTPRKAPKKPCPQCHTSLAVAAKSCTCGWTHPKGAALKKAKEAARTATVSIDMDTGEEILLVAPKKSHSKPCPSCASRLASAAKSCVCGWTYMESCDHNFNPLSQRPRKSSQLNEFRNVGRQQRIVTDVSTTATKQRRLEEHPNEALELRDLGLWCLSCNRIIGSGKQSCAAHLITKKHRKNKA
jgi:hypothetical protein